MKHSWVLVPNSAIVKNTNIDMENIDEEEVMHKKKREFKKKMVFVLAIIAIFFISLSAAAQKDAEGPLLSSSEPFISLNITQMSIYDVLRLVAEKADLSMVIKEKINDEITLRVKNASLWQTLEIILEDTGFTYEKKNGIITIAALEEAKEEIAAEESFPVMEIIFLKFLRAGEVIKMCRDFLSPSGMIEIEPRVNALILIDAPQNIKKIQQLMARLSIKSSQFVLSGIISGPEDGDSLAVINGEILRIGQRLIDDFLTVDKIEQNTVTLKYEEWSVVLKL